MNKLLILALCLVSVLCVKRVTIAPSATMDAVSLQDRVNYVKGANHMYFCAFDEIAKTYTSTVRQNAPDLTKIKSLDAVWYGKNKAGIQVDPPTLTTSTTGGYLYLTATYTSDQLVEAYGCLDMPVNPNYVGKTCTFTVDYLATDQGQVVLTTDFGVSIKIPKTGTASATTNAVKLYKKGCDCEIISTLPLTVEIFTDDACTVKFAGSSFKYGDRVCLKMSTSSSLASTYYFEVASIIMAYPANGVQTTQEMKPVARIVCGTQAACVKGMASASFDMLVVGDPVTFTVTVILRDSSGQRRLLQEVSPGKGLEGTSPGVKVISSAAGLTVTVLSFLAVLLFFL